MSIIYESPRLTRARAGSTAPCCRLARARYTGAAPSEQQIEDYKDRYDKLNSVATYFELNFSSDDKKAYEEYDQGERIAETPDEKNYRDNLFLYVKQQEKIKQLVLDTIGPLTKDNPSDVDIDFVARVHKVYTDFQKLVRSSKGTPAQKTPKIEYFTKVNTAMENFVNEMEFFYKEIKIGIKAGYIMKTPISFEENKSKNTSLDSIKSNIKELVKKVNEVTIEKEVNAEIMNKVKKEVKELTDEKNSEKFDKYELKSEIKKSNDDIDNIQNVLEQILSSANNGKYISLNV